MFTLPSLCLALILLSVPTEALRLMPERLRHIRYHAPRDFHDCPQMQARAASSTGGSGLLATGTGTAFTSYTTQYYNYTFAGDWKSKAISSVGGLGVTASTTPVTVGTPMVTVEPAYQVCDPASSSCSTILQTRTTTVCSGVLTGFFTRVTVTDCDQSVTFSTKSSFSLITSTGLAARQAQVTPYVQSVVSYFIAPWQSIAANTPGDITIVVCTFDAAGNQICNNVQEVWVVHTELVPVVQTSTITVSQYFSSSALVIMNDGQTSLVAPGGAQFFATVVYTTVSANLSTSTSQVTVGDPYTTLTSTVQNTVQVTGVVNIVTTTITQHSTSTRTVMELETPQAFNATSLTLSSNSTISNSTISGNSTAAIVRK